VEKVACRRKSILISPRIDLFRKRVVGQKVIEVGRIGKRVVLHLASGDRVILEPRMTGLVVLADPPSVEHLRVRFQVQGGPLRQFWYWDRRGLGSVRLLNPQEFEKTLLRGKLGPDALIISAADLRERLRKSARPIKVALLDQAKVAGVGNLYASELLHRAGIHPARRCLQLKITDWERLHTCMVEVLQEAIRYEGSTLSDGTYRNALNKAAGYQNHHRVYDRAELPCPTCQSPIIRIVQAQRATFYCPGCQRRR